MAVGTTYLEAMKKAAGLTASYYDSEVTDLIEQARLELIRCGIASIYANSETDQLVKGVIRTFVQANKAENSAEAERLTVSFGIQIESLQKTANYRSDF